MDISEIFDPENVKIFNVIVEERGYECPRSVVLLTDYDKLLELYRAVKPRQITISEVYGEIEIK